MGGIRLFSRVRELLHGERGGSAAMLLAAACAMIAANSALSGWYQGFIHAPVSIALAGSAVTEPLEAWVKDLAMAFFFLLVGLELKLEFVQGALSHPKKAMLPLLAALGGMAAPSFIFWGFNAAHPQHWRGWAVPSATDIAFALGLLAFVARRAPPAVKAFLLAIAIFDDLGAILIIAFFYSGGADMPRLGLTLACALMLLLLNRRGATALPAYLAVGAAMWLCLFHSGVHPTLAGVAAGLAVPHRNEMGRSPLKRALHGLHPWVTFLVLPLFAFVSAGVDFSGMRAEEIASPLAIGVALGLFAGKQIGIFGVSWLAVRLRIAKLPDGVTWLHIYGVATLAGIGFTMSLFIGMLAFPDSSLYAQTKIGVLLGSALSAGWGIIVFRYCSVKAGKP